MTTNLKHNYSLSTITTYMYAYMSMQKQTTVCSHTHWWCFHYETYCGISQYRTRLYYMWGYTCCMHACCVAGERLMLFRRVLWSSVMSVNSTLICGVESFGLSCEKIQTVFIFVRYGKIQHMSKE